VKDDVWLAVAAVELVADDIEGKRRKKSAGEREREGPTVVPGGRLVVGLATCNEAGSDVGRRLGRQKESGTEKMAETGG
jgi:hypothetical protein